MPEQHFIQGDCPNCGAKNKDIQAWYDGQYDDEKKVSHEERLKRILKKYGYPPDKQKKATETVLEQAELICKDWTGS